MQPIEVDAQHPRCSGEQHLRLAAIETADGCVRVQAARPQHLAAVDVADARRHSLVEQHLADRALGVARAGATDGVVEVDAGDAQVRPERAKHLMALDRRVVEQLDHRRIEADGDRARHLEHQACP